MPRLRKQVARFDPSPEVVASWNDTSGKTRLVVDLQARVRLGLSSAEAAEAAIAAAKAKAAAEAAAAAEAERAAVAVAAAADRRPPAGRKRQRSSSSSSLSGAGNAASSYPPPISNLRAGGSRDSVAAYSSSVSCSTSGSGSDSDSSYSCGASSSRIGQRLAWRPAQAAGGGGSASRGGGGGGGGAASVSASGASSDTDSEYCSDLVVGQQGGSGSSSANSEGSSSCSMTPLGFGDSSATTTIADGAEGGRVSPDVGVEGNGNGKHRLRDGEGVDEERRRAAKKRRNVVTVRVARSQMPARWAAPPPPFETCLKDVRPEDKLGGTGGAASGGDDAAAAAAASMLGLCEGDVVDAKNWLSSGFIDVVMAKFARTYTNVHFMPIDFAVLCLNGWGAADAAAAGPAPAPPPGGSARSSSTSGGGGSSAAADGGPNAVDESMVFKDILGRPIVYSEKRPVIFLTHVNNVHWNLLRVEHDPVPELQLFEPMGKPPRRQGGSRYTQQQPQPGGGSGARGGGFRCIPKEVYRWLDSVWPLRSGGSGGTGGSPVGGGGGGSGSGGRKKSPSPTPPHEGWASRAYSAITRQQQTTGFDCGVASLLYAEKCGQGQMREDVDAWTTQGDLTEYRRALQRYVEEVLRQPPPPTPTPPAAAPGDAPPDPEVVVVDPPSSPLPLPPSSASPPASALAVPAALPVSSSGP